MKDKLRKLAVALIEKDMTICTVEQCTHGLIGASIASVMESYYKGTMTLVNCDQMETLMDVPNYTIKQNGIKSSAVANQLALNGLYKMDCDVCIAAVGDVKDEECNIWICVAAIIKGKGRRRVEFAYDFVKANGQRSENIEEAIHSALKLATKKVKNEQG